MHQRTGAGPGQGVAALDARKEGTMTERRDKTLSARFNDQELAAVNDMAASYGMPVAAYMRATALKQALRRSGGNRKDAARILGQLGKVADELRALRSAGLDPESPHLAAAWRDLAEMRTACLQTLGFEP